MSSPAYLWLTDENGSPMVSSCLVPGREGAIELKSFTHNVNIPVDGNIIFTDSWNERATY